VSNRLAAACTIKEYDVALLPILQQEAPKHVTSKYWFEQVMSAAWCNVKALSVATDKHMFCHHSATAETTEGTIQNHYTAKWFKASIMSVYYNRIHVLVSNDTGCCKLWKRPPLQAGLLPITAVQRECIAWW
jgi:hypothetical protein